MQKCLEGQPNEKDMSQQMKCLNSIRKVGNGEKATHDIEYNEKENQNSLCFE